jgi:putative membrane protein
MTRLSLRVAAVGLASGVVVASIALAQAQPFGGPGMMGGWGGNGFGIGPFGPILMVLAIAVIVVASVWFLRRFAPVGPQRMAGSRSGGLDVLEQRYARGEVDRDEYLQKKGDLLA